MNGDALVYIIWIGLAVLIGYYASTRKNHNGIVWFLLALVFSPLLVGIIALLMGPRITQADLVRAASGPAVPFAPALRVPPEGMSSWARPDPSGPVTPLAGRLELAIIHRVDDWAQVRASNGWVGWVDARRLVPLAPPPAPVSVPPPPPA
jgi:hypothetical protein